MGLDGRKEEKEAREKTNDVAKASGGVGEGQATPL